MRQRKGQKFHSLDIPELSPILRGMKRCLLLAGAAAIIVSLTSCGAMGRTMGSVGRTFGNYTGAQPQVIR